MPKIVPIVEGDGEMTATPVLFRKLLDEMNRYDIQVASPKNAHGRGNLQKTDGLERFVKYAWKEPDCGAIFILLDSEDECPREIARNFSQRIETLGVLYPVVIACAKRMYETWFLASIETIVGKDLNGRPGLTNKNLAISDAESIKSPKGWLNRLFPPGRAYRETADQEALTRLLDTSLAKERSRSFRRLCHALEQALEAINTGSKIVTPSFTDSDIKPSATGYTAVRKRGRKRQK